MKKLPVAALWLFAGVAAANIVFVGCGSDSTDESTADAGDEASNDSGSTGDLDAGGQDAFIDAITDAHVDALTCKTSGTSCTASNECCTANCAPLADGGTEKFCQAPLNECKLPGAACANNTECCTFSCAGGTCSDKQCVPDSPTSGACAQNSDCCSQNCQPDGKGGGLCKPVPLPGGGTTTCRGAGNTCAADTDCCSKLCNNGVCSQGGSFCTQIGDVCANDFDCCGGACQKASGSALGTCAVVSAPGSSGCDSTGTICGYNDGGVPPDGGIPCGGNCCSRACAPYGAGGTNVCQPPSGCKPTGEICRNDSDCCGWSGSAAAGLQVNGPVSCAKSSDTQEFGRCNNGGACREPGSICKPADYACNAENDCCEPATYPDGGTGVPSNYCNNNPDNCCRRDALGIPRCLVQPFTTCENGPPPSGTKCATSADCCNNPCVNNQCAGTACVSQGGTCTTDGDCCTGLPCTKAQGASSGICGGTLLPDGGVSDAGPTPTDGGSTTDAGGNLPDGGTCALYGQTCTASAECCNGVPCTTNRCRYP